MSEQPHYVIVKSIRAWAEQATAAVDAIRTANDGQDPPSIRDGYDIDPVAFGQMVEALVALESETGRPVSQELRDLAGLRPVDEVL